MALRASSADFTIRLSDSGTAPLESAAVSTCSAIDEIQLQSNPIRQAGQDTAAPKRGRHEMVTNQLQRQVYTLFADSSSFCSAKFQNKKFFCIISGYLWRFLCKNKGKKGNMVCFSFVTILYFFPIPWGEGGTVAACNGVGFVLLGRRGNGCAPHFFFSCKRKRNVPRPIQRKRERGAAFVAKAAPSFFAPCPEAGFPGAMRTGFTACAADANGCGKGAFFAVRNREHFLLNAAAARTQYNL